MRFLFRVLGFAVLAFGASARATTQTLPAKAEVLETMRLTNAYFMREWADPGKEIVTNRVRPSHIWTRAVYYEGLLALYRLDPKPAYYDYAILWSQSHNWGLRTGRVTRNADDQCCGQAYLELYDFEPKPERIRDITASIDAMVGSKKTDDWSWIDAVQMAMPVFAKLGVQSKDSKYFEKMYALFSDTKSKQGGSGLYNEEEHLWWRDKDFLPPFKEPNGKNCYWSRGNGWVIAAMARVLEVLPSDAPHRSEYVKMLSDMAAALKPLQRDDGFWNASLMDPTNFGGKETTGTALFVYGMAWGVSHGILNAKEYGPTIAKGWNAIVRDAVHADGFLGYVQGTGKQPSEGQPVTYDHRPDFDDYGLGCVLLAGSEVYGLAPE